MNNQNVYSDNNTSFRTKKSNIGEINNNNTSVTKIRFFLVY